MTIEQKVTYHYDKSSGILHKKYHGSIQLDDIFNSWKDYMENRQGNEKINGFILDYRDANFQIEPIDATKISAFYRAHLDFFGGFKIAIITDSPKDIVIPTLVALENHGYESRPFATMEAAKMWVLEQ